MSSSPEEESQLEGRSGGGSAETQPRRGLRVITGVWAILGGLVGAAIGALALQFYTELAAHSTSYGTPIAYLLKKMADNLPNWLLFEQLRAGAHLVLGCGLIIAGLLYNFGLRIGKVYFVIYAPLVVILACCYATYELLFVAPNLEASARLSSYGRRAEGSPEAAQLGIIIFAVGMTIHAIILTLLLFGSRPRSTRKVRPAAG